LAFPYDLRPSGGAGWPIFCRHAGLETHYIEGHMPKLKAKGLKWLKGFHLIAVTSWVGGGVALILLYFLKDGVTDSGVLYGINQSIHHVDMAVVVIPGAFGCLLTGLIYSSFSNWGFFKHNWMIFKWIVTVTAILFGTFFLGPWETAMMEISGKIGISSLSDPAYLYNQKMNLVFGALQVLVLMITVFISIFKPWKSGKKGKRVD
jgi:uncharacterized membrane protein